MIEVVNYTPFQRHIPRMHDSEPMAAIQGAKLAPVQGGHSQEIHTSVIKKTFEPVAKPSTAPSGGFPNSVTDDEDDFSDHDSHYSEDLEDIFAEETVEETPDVTKQLLGFADMINSDIQKFFGRKKEEEDSCDIYEEKWVTVKSGRELYYADLVKIAHGEDKDKGSRSPLLDISKSSKESVDNRSKFSGKLDRKMGLGPLNDLFDYGLRQFLSDQKTKPKETKRFKADPKRFEGITPMQSRKLPTSFWHEPGAPSGGEIRDSRVVPSSSVTHANNPPDFSDLLESWRLDRSEFSRDVSSSEMSMSPESAIEHV